MQAAATTTSPPSAIIKELKRTQDARLHFGRLQSLESAQRMWFADIPAGLPIDAVLEPSYWTNFTKIIKPDDLIRARCEDGSWAADLWVMLVGTIEIKVSVWHFSKLDGTASPGTEDSEVYAVKWLGPGAKFAVVHRANGSIIKDRLYPKSEAYAYLQKHLGTMKA